jgi:hypothetical protein
MTGFSVDVAETVNVPEVVGRTVIVFPDWLTI